jgi:hypothetical protein
VTSSSELVKAGCNLIDALLEAELDMDERRVLANKLAEHCLARCYSDSRSPSGRVQVPKIVPRTPKPPKP